MGKFRIAFIVIFLMLGFSLIMYMEPLARQLLSAAFLLVVLSALKIKGRAGAGAALLVMLMALSVFIVSLGSFRRAAINDRLAGGMFCDGYDWRRIVREVPAAPGQTEVMVRATLLKLTVESSAVTGPPIFKSDISLPECMNFLDKFYEVRENRGVPIFFAMKIADMAKSGSSPAEINTYQAALMKKLNY